MASDETRAAPAQIGRQARHWIEKVLAKSPFAGPIGIEVISIEPERVRLRLPYRAELTTVGTVVHGGAIATLVDVAGAAASASAIRDDDGATGGATASLTLSFIAPASEANLEAEAVVLQRSRTQTISDIFVRDEAGTLLAKGTIMSRIFYARAGAARLQRGSGSESR
ncbi:MAG: PaaI family thioesterase [Burkholderiaceae bacterium]